MCVVSMGLCYANRSFFSAILFIFFLYVYLRAFTDTPQHFDAAAAAAAVGCYDRVRKICVIYFVLGLLSRQFEFSIVVAHRIIKTHTQAHRTVHLDPINCVLFWGGENTQKVIRFSMASIVIRLMMMFFFSFLYPEIFWNDFFFYKINSREKNVCSKIFCWNDHCGFIKRHICIHRHIFDPSNPWCRCIRFQIQISIRFNLNWIESSNCSTFLACQFAHNALCSTIYDRCEWK